VLNYCEILLDAIKQLLYSNPHMRKLYSSSFTS